MMAYRVGEYTKRRRRQLGISRGDLAYDICSERTLARLEGGKSSPESSVYEQIMRRLGLFPGRVNVHSGDMSLYYKERHQVEWLLLHNKTDEAIRYTDFLRNRDAVTDNEASRLAEIVSQILDFRKSKSSPEEHIAASRKVLLQAVESVCEEAIANAVLTLTEMVACIEFARGLDAAKRKSEAVAILKAFISNLKRGLTSGYEHKLLLLTALTLCARLSLEQKEYATAIGCCREAYICACGEDIYSAQLLYIEAIGFEKARLDGTDRNSEWPYEQMSEKDVNELKWMAYYVADMLGDISLRDAIGIHINMG